MGCGRQRFEWHFFFFFLCTSSSSFFTAKKPRAQELKIERDDAAPPQNRGGVLAPLDATAVDVYKGTHGVLLLFDISKRWSFDYVVKLLPAIPETIPVLLLGNCRDRGDQRAVLDDEIKEFVEEHKSRTSLLTYAECSMANGFGLKFIHRFFSIPYLTLHVRTPSFISLPEPSFFILFFILSPSAKP